jgi:uncharacterized protein (TIGR03435 family)
MKLHARAILTLFIVIACVMRLAAQLSFEVASIRPSTSLSPGGTMGPKPGRFLASNVPAIAFITLGYDVKRYQIVGAPDWSVNDRYNLEATTGGQPGMEQLREMMRSLLADRFQLRTHRETREIDGYALVRVSPDTLGPTLRPSTLNCADPKAGCGMNFGPGFFRAGHITMAVLADLLAADGNAGGLVVDRTGVAGVFDVELEWASDLEPSDRPSIFTAVQEQLGLRLQREKVPVEVIVIDRMARPSEN